MSDWKKLAEQYCQTGTLRYYFADGLRVDLASDTWTVINETGESRLATEVEIAEIQRQLLSKPLLKPLMKRREAMELFTETEKAAIRISAPGLIELLLAAEEPVSSAVLIPYLSQLKADGILTAERFTEITGE